MTVKQTYPTQSAFQIAHDLVIDDVATPVYSDAFMLELAEVWNTHFEWADDAADLAFAVTLWGTDKDRRDDTDDTDWVQMTTDHGFTGLPGGDPTGGDGKDMVDVSASGALWYRWKFVQSAGSGVLQAYVSKRDRR